MSTLDIKHYRRKVFPADGVLVTVENMALVAEWCGGEVVEAADGVDIHVKVLVNRPNNERQTMGFVGDTVLRVGRSFKVFTEGALTATFDEEVATFEEGVAAPSRSQKTASATARISDAMWVPKTNAA